MKPGRKADDFINVRDFMPTFLEAAGVEVPKTVTGQSFLAVLKAEKSGWVDSKRNRMLVGKERHDLGRPGDAGYPARGVLRGEFLYVRNYAPDRWPMGDPITGYLNTDGGPTKTLLLEENRRGLNHWRWELNFGRRPAEELYDLAHDPDCLNNLAGDPAHAARRAALAGELLAELRRTGDPRAASGGEEFDRYPYASPLLGFYERYLRGEKLNAGWVEPGDFEARDFDPERPLRPRSSASP